MLQSSVAVKSDAVPHSNCEYCGTPVFGLIRGKPLRFCRPTDGREASKCAKSFYNKKQATPQFYKDRYNREQSDPKQREKKLRLDRLRIRRKHSASKKVGRARFKLIDDAVSKSYLRDTRMEIVAEACLLYSEGHTLEDAIKLATKKVNKGNELQNYKSKDIDDCFWLGDDTGMPY